VKAAKGISLEEIDLWFEQHKEEMLAERIEEMTEGLKKRMLKSTGLPPKNAIVRKPNRKRLAVDMAQEIDVLADQLRRQGVADPITQARDKLAQQWRFASGQSLHKWLRRNR
jgi:hypothetical protein